MCEEMCWVMEVRSVEVCSAGGNRGEEAGKKERVGMDLDGRDGEGE